MILDQKIKGDAMTYFFRCIEGLKWLLVFGVVGEGECGNFGKFWDRFFGCKKWRFDKELREFFEVAYEGRWLKIGGGVGVELMARFSTHTICDEM